MPRIVSRKKIISMDTETTGIDFYHGAKPYFVTTSDLEGDQSYWEWEVDPRTREPVVPPGDVREIQDLVDDPSVELVFQNAKFDLRALSTIGVSIPEDLWGRIYDTVISGHLLDSKGKHDLTSMVLRYLGIDIDPLDMRLKKACRRCQLEVKKKYRDWGIVGSEKAKGMMPSVRGSAPKADGWLPRAVAVEEGLPEDHEFWTVLRDYANGDSYSTVKLHSVHAKMIEERRLGKIYRERMRALRSVYETEEAGVTLGEDETKRIRDEFREESEKFGRVCTRIAARRGYDLVLPKSGNNSSLRTMVFGEMKMPVVSRSKKTGEPQLTRAILERYDGESRLGSWEKMFLRALLEKRRRDTAVQYIDGYMKFWRPVAPGFSILNPSLNLTGTSTLRMSSSNPNEQNISRQEGFGVRSCFRPLPGRVWWSIDYENLELRIPGYESGEPAMVELFERPDQPPYFGSYHLLIFSILHPDKYDRDDPEGLRKAKKRYETTWYKFVKLGNFADLYGAQESSGTADRAFHVKGAQRIVAERLRRKAELNDRWVRYAEEHGYVETIPDSEIDPERGYPLECPRTEWSRILPTVPLNYHVQGTACWVMMRAMTLVDEMLRREGIDGKIVMNVHDEIVLDLPDSRDGPRVVRDVVKIMEERGGPVGVRLTCSVSYYPVDWGSSVENESWRS